MNKILTFILILLVSCNSQKEKLDKVENSKKNTKNITVDANKTSEKQKEASTELQEKSENSEEIELDEDCIFDQATQTDKFLHGIEELKNYHWNYKNRTAKLRLKNGDSLTIYRGGCDHFGVSVTMKVFNDSIDYSDWNKVNEKVLWIAKILDKEFDYKIIKTELDAQKTTIEKEGKGESVYFSNEYLGVNNYRIYRELNNKFDLIELSYYMN